MKISLTPIDISQKEILRKMLYDYELEMMGEDPGEYKYLDSYFEKPSRTPLFIEVDGKIAGFALINGYTLTVQDAKSMSEFYVEKSYRGMGVGKEAARLSFAMFPGKWEVREIEKNKTATIFWNKVLAELTKGNYKEEILNTEQWQGPVQTFDFLTA